MPTDDVDRFAGLEPEQLRLTAIALEAEIVELRRRLLASPRRVQQLETQLSDMELRLSRTLGRNEKLSSLLEEAREQLGVMRAEVEKLTTPPNAFGVVVSINEDGTLDIVSSNRKLRVTAQPNIEVKSLQIGQQVLLNEGMSVVDVRDFDDRGEVVRVRDKLADGRMVVIARTDDELVIQPAASLEIEAVRVGDYLRLDAKSGLVFERLARPEVEELVLEEVPDVTYEDVGGLSEQIEMIRDAVELPYIHRDLFGEYELVPPKGILLYGPPGCGKTLIAKAVANSLAAAVAARSDRPDAKSYFLNIKGPELLNKWVGETERQIRLIFQRAKEKSEEGVPVIVFFDEMDSLFRTRGSGISSDVESTIVPQLLSELDGVESLKNVIVIGASNREDLIDPAILRPGRLDVKIKINRPDRDAATQIFRIYMTAGLPIGQKALKAAGGDRAAAFERMVAGAVEVMYDDGPDNRFLEVTYANGDREILYFRDFASGAMIENVVRRAKKSAIKRVIDGGAPGVEEADLVEAVRQEFREHEDLPNTTNPDDWAKISGKKGERITYVRTLIGTGGASRMVDGASTGQYL